MDHSKIDFDISTFKKIKRFHEGLSELQGSYPDFSFEQARKYLAAGNRQEDMPQEIYDRIDELEQIRESAIANEMKHAAAKASLNGKNIPEKYVTGKALNPMFEPSVYEFSASFAVYDYFRWYSDEELARLIYEPFPNDLDL